MDAIYLEKKDFSELMTYIGRSAMCLGKGKERKYGIKVILASNFSMA